MPPSKFEEALTRLETIVGQLEKGDLPLEESLKIFEEGVRLSKNCLKMLEEAERKVEILLQDKEGRKRPEPFRLDEANPEETHDPDDQD
ncbi:MAG: exodeoxyribonuclease VII small subunit [Nitrospirae bacterium]|nr:exodeoxyribonuclease VII small subunit [Nitrospirota bacterium]